MFRKLLEKIFKGGPIYTEKEVEFMGQKIKMQVYNVRRLHEAIEKAPHGSIMFTSPRTFISISHVDMSPPDVVDEPPMCDLDCENCGKFLGYGKEEENGC